MKKVSKGIRSEFKKMLSADKSDKYSSKRVITFTAFVLISIAFIVNLIWGITVDPIILNGMIQIVWAGLGMVMGEHLLMKRHPRQGGSHGGPYDQQHGGGFDPYGQEEFPYDQHGGGFDPHEQEFPYGDDNPEEFGDN